MKPTTVIVSVLLVIFAASAARSQPAIPDNIRELIPELSGQKVLLAFSSDDSDHATLEIPRRYAEVAEAYKNHFVDRGWKVEMEMSMEDTRMLSFSRDGRTLSIMIARSDEDSASVNLNLERR